MDKTKKDNNEIIELLNKKLNILITDNNTKVDSKKKENQEINEHKNNLKIENFDEITKNLLTENEIVNIKKKEEENKGKINEKIIEQNKENFINRTSNEISNEKISLQKDNNENLKTNNYKTNEKIDNSKIIGYISLKNSFKEDLYNNFFVQKTNIISYAPKKFDNKNYKCKEQNNQFYKVKPRSKINNNKINLKKHKLQINCDTENIFNKILNKRNNSTIKSKTQHRIFHSEERRK